MAVVGVAIVEVEVREQQLDRVRRRGIYVVSQGGSARDRLQHLKTDSKTKAKELFR